jgi:hypothetical protein
MSFFFPVNSMINTAEQATRRSILNQPGWMSSLFDTEQVVQCLSNNCGSLRVTQDFVVDAARLVVESLSAFFA